jgi:hypothetical protein
MTREIKFRAWNDIDKTMISWSVITCTNFLSEMLNGRSKHYTPMQFTGLKDNSGKEIYEHMELDGLFEVSFKDCCYVLINISNGDIVGLGEYMESKNGKVEITREYTKV